ncbi:MAG: phytochelatin synthase family protein [Methylosarcina sp.]
MLQRYRKLLALFQTALLLGACSSAPLTKPEESIPPSSLNATHQPLIALNSAEGEHLLFDSHARTDYVPLSIYFETQQNLAYCGAASMAMVLNALNMPAPVTPEYGRHALFTQNNVFNEKTERIIRAKIVAHQGMTLEELGKLLASHSLQTKVIFSGDSHPDQFRNLAVENLKQPGNFILVNYLRKTVGQETGGHISPLAAYHESTDRFLILDVTRFKYPPVWVTTEQLWRAMNTVDKASGKTRGFVLIKRPANTGNTAR